MDELTYEDYEFIHESLIHYRNFLNPDKDGDNGYYKELDDMIDRIGSQLIKIF